MSASFVLTFALLGWTLLAKDVEAQPASVGATVSGRVVSTASGSIADATVTLTPLDAPWAAPLTVTSDHVGGFTLSNVPAGRYRVSASSPGYTSRQPLRGAADAFESGREITLRDDERADFGELILYRESSIAGRVAEPDGIPAPDVQVFAAVPRGTGYAILRETRVIAGWDGRYRITGLPPGEYLIVVMPGLSASPNRMREVAERRAPESSSAARPFFEPTLYPGVSTPAAAETVTVFEGIPVDGIDTWLIPGERHSIAGRILRPEDTTVDNVVIEYANLTAGRSGLWTVPEPGDIFNITGVPPGTVVLLARADSNRGPLVGAVSTQVNVDEIDDIELRLETPGRIEGRIVYDLRVPPQQRATHVTLKQRLLPVSALYPVPEGAVGADGTFRIDGLLGDYEFEVEGLRVVRVRQHGREIPGGRIRVAPGVTLSGLEVVATR
nr:hypothetical protein [uncultured bacterium]